MDDFFELHPPLIVQNPYFYRFLSYLAIIWKSLPLTAVFSS